MTDFISIFKDNQNNQSHEEMINGAMKCMDKFGQCFENEDLVGMDKCCHFPHYILSGNEMICWNEQGNLTKEFFEDLKKKGFMKTVVDYREVILICENKVHLKYGYSRISLDGSVMSKHNNVWILTYKNDMWGIELRSY